MQKVAAAFVKAQRAFAPALKSSLNPHFRSKYADLASCVEAVIDALNTNGIALIQQTHDDASGVTVETTFIHESGETLSGGKLHFPATKQDAQGYASALTYARRYSLMAACGIAPEDDDGNAASKPAKAPVATAKAVIDLTEAKAMLNSCENMTQLQVAWAGLTKDEQALLVDLKDEIKAKVKDAK